LKLFGSSGIRGLVNKDITPHLAQKVGQAIASQYEGGAILVGRDSRLSGPMLESALNSGIVSTGFIAGSLGVVPTPVVAWLTKEMQAEAGIAITASHNPPEYNGLKIFHSNGMAYTTEQQVVLEALIEGGEYTKAGWSRIGKVEPIDGANIYADTISQAFDFKRDWIVAGDLYNGATCTVAPIIFKELGMKPLLMNAQIDGHFPAGKPEPDRESLKPLARMVRRLKASIGFGFDGDGDRMMAVTEKGRVPNPDRVLAAYARYVVATSGGGVVVTHVGASKCIEDAVEQAGGKVVRTKVGDIYITETMKEHGAVFGGEPVGAWVHPDVNMCPDGVLSALRLMQALDNEGQKLSEFIADIPKYSTLRDKVECPRDRKEKSLEEISKSYKKKFGTVSDVNNIDGVRLELKDGWVLMRPSGTEPYMRITVEAVDVKKAEKFMETAKAFVSDVLGA
jgi:phosphoglucosamine mutase